MVTIFPIDDAVVKIPSENRSLSPSVIFRCGLEPTSLVPQVNYTTRWTTPEGEIVNSTRDNFLLIEGIISQFPGTLLLIQQISYLDAGKYTCEGIGTITNDTSSWASASIELQLDSKLMATCMNHTLHKYNNIMYNLATCS